MLETIRAWLNGSREYYTGVAIYSQLGTNEDLLQVLKKGPNEFRVKRLQEDLLDICNELKQKDVQENFATESGPVNDNVPKYTDALCKNACGNNKQKYEVPPANEQLYAACKSEADLQYKKVMNARALLFKLAEHDYFENPNLPDKVNERSSLALEVVQGHQLASHLYDQADYVRIHGRLPNADPNQDENEYDHLPDSLVKPRLDNLRKAYNKLKAKDPTPERIALLQQHEFNIKKLETKWLSLKPVQ